MTLNLKAVLAKAAADRAGGELKSSQSPALPVASKPELSDSLLDELVLAPSSQEPTDFFLDMSLGYDVTGADRIDIVELAPGEIDPRLKLLSHSSRGLLHKCPRKYQLYRLSSETVSLEESKEIEQSVTFAYGTVVGIGMQSCLEGKSEDQILLDCFLGWDADLLDSNPRQKKSFWLALFAVQKFCELRAGGFLEDYELVYYNGKPAVELSFQVLLPGDFIYRGFVDAVLRHKSTGEVIVLEAKTSSGTANSATYKNSGQALGYSVVLDKLFPEMSSYTVLYLVYESKSYEYVELPFKKSLLQRALWLQELLIDCKTIELYNEYGTYPMHGEACFDYFRDCEYLSLCTLETKNLTKPLTSELLAKIEQDGKSYDFTVTFGDLVETQIRKGALGSSEEASEDIL